MDVARHHEWHAHLGSGQQPEEENQLSMYFEVPYLDGAGRQTRIGMHYGKTTMADSAASLSLILQLSIGIL